MTETTTHITLYLNGEGSSRALDALPAGFNPVPVEQKMLYFVDGGFRHFKKKWQDLKLEKLKTGLEQIPRIHWIGDADSMDSELHEFLHDNPSSGNVIKTTFDPIKDFSDFAAALDHIHYNCKGQRVFLEIFNGLGGRRDHEFINILEANRFAQQHQCACTIVFHPSVVVTNTPVDLHLARNSLFSIITFGKPAQVLIEGALYEGDILLQRPSHGLSNVATAETQKVSPVACTLTLFREDV